MTRREAVTSALLIFVVALVVRAFFAAQIVFPKPEDTAYYVGVARNLLEGRGLVTDALWSYGTPPLEFPRAAFEVWMPLPSFLAVVPMAIFGATFASAQMSSILVGALVPVLAWRLAVDVAVERELPTVRARTLTLGVGLTTAVYLPVLLHSALPGLDDAVRGPGARGVPPDDPDRARSPWRPTRGSAPARAGRVPGPRGADPQRGRLAGARLGRDRLDGARCAAPGARAPDRRRRRRRPRDLRAVDAPQLARVRESAAGPGGVQRLLDHRLRHLRVERPAHAFALPRRRPRAPAGDAGRRAVAQPGHRPAADRHPDLAHRPRGAAVAGPGSGGPAASCSSVSSPSS